jgi:centromeric protein E
VTPASSNSEETHNTLKFAHRAKHIEIQAAQNKIIDEKSLIKKYQYEIRQLKEELEQLKQGIKPVSQLKDISGDDIDIVLLKQKVCFSALTPV